MTVRLGLDRLLEEQGGLVRGRRVGLLAHPASVSSGLRHAEEVLVAVGARLEALFGPEHGYGGEAQDMEAVEAPGARAGPRVYSLYGPSPESLRPSAETLAGLDVLVVDLQDVGSRYYTYVWTAAMCLEAASPLGVTMLVLDRPNPIGGRLVEGHGIEPGLASFVGYHDVVTRHGMTIAELLGLFARERGLDDGLEVLRLEGWDRDLHHDETGLPWVLPSPNMPSVETALVYPGSCLLEGTNLSEGRGTTRPFEIVGAPWLDGLALRDLLERDRLPGCAFRPCTFRPTFQKHAGRLCGGVQVHVTDRRAFRPLRTGLALLRAAFALGRGQTRFRAAPYEFVSDRPAIDLLAGGSWLREGLEAGAETASLWQGLDESEASFEARRAAALLYPSGSAHGRR